MSFYPILISTSQQHDRLLGHSLPLVLCSTSSQWLQSLPSCLLLLPFAGSSASGVRSSLKVQFKLLSLLVLQSLLDNLNNQQPKKS